MIEFDKQEENLIMKKRLFLSAMLFLVLIVIITVYICTSFKRITEIGSFQDTDITKIIFQYDNPAIKGRTVENKEKIKEFMKYINSCVVSKKWDQTPMTGYDQMAVLSIGDKEVMNILFYKNFIEINGIQYNMVKDKLSTEKIDDFIKSI